jgi:hypothetical protein
VCSSDLVPVPGAPGLSVLNIDPDNAAESYRQRVLAQMGADATPEVLSTVREQLSGACTTEIASFDEFSSLLADAAETYDHIVFDTGKRYACDTIWSRRWDCYGIKCESRQCPDITGTWKMGWPIYLRGWHLT